MASGGDGQSGRQNGIPAGNGAVVQSGRELHQGANGEKKIPLWLDCDPGHDDALAIFLAGYHPKAQLLGVSTVFGNEVVEKVTANACLSLHVAGLTEQKVHMGQEEALLRPKKTCSHIHGESGMDWAEQDGEDDAFSGIQDLRAELPKTMMDSTKPVLAIRNAVVSVTEQRPGTVVYLIATAAMTNIALFLKLFPELIPHVKVVCMCGTTAEGNIGPVVEFNVNVDPEAAKIVFTSGVDLTMIPLQITHTALATKDVLSRILAGHQETTFKSFIHQLLLFFAETYKGVYGFDDPPIHDPCAVFYALEPECFEVDHLRVDIETVSELSAGQTVCDIWRQSGLPPNCHVGRKMNVDKFWNAMIAAIDLADRNSPLNHHVPGPKP